MQKVQSTLAVEGRGLSGCRHAKKPKTGGKRQVLLVDEASRVALRMLFGALKENLVIAGLPLDSLPAGQRLRIGAALIEISEPCVPCWKLDRIREGLLSASWGRRGQLGRVLESGLIQEGDEVTLEGVNPDAPKPINPKLP